jgi:hypothetical protein
MTGFEFESSHLSFIHPGTFYLIAPYLLVYLCGPGKMSFDFRRYLAGPMLFRVKKNFGRIS